MDNNGKTKMGAPVRPPEGDNPLATLRRLRGWSQKEAAEALGVSQPMLSMYERGVQDIPKPVRLLIDILLGR